MPQSESVSNRLALFEDIHAILTQRDEAQEKADYYQGQSEEWERTARGSSADAVGWQSKAQAVQERVWGLAAELEILADRGGVQDDELRLMVDRLRRATSPEVTWSGDGEVVRTEETVKVGDKL